MRATSRSGSPAAIADVSAQGLYPAEHRALRELHATTRSLARHWEKLGDALGLHLLEAGAASARELLRELADRGAQHDVHGVPAAQGVGVQLSRVQRVSDRLLERNQALRLALLDVQHVVTLLGWLAALADRREDADWTAWHQRWAGELARHEDALRTAVVDLAADPDGAVEPAVDTFAGRIGHKAAVTMGTLGEAIDASTVGRRARRQ